MIKQDEITKRNPRFSFMHGCFKAVKPKNHYHQQYDRICYSLPSKLSYPIKFLKKYFKKLDSLYDTPVQFQYRQSEFEFAETAIYVFYDIYQKINKRIPIIIGSQFVSPCPWAILGPTSATQNKNKLIRYNFPNIQSIFNHYDSLIWKSGFNYINIDRYYDSTKNPETDFLILLSKRFYASPNYILAIAIFLLFDIVKHCGPDSEEFPMVFSNDNRGTLNYDYWKRTRHELNISQQSINEILKSNSSIRLSSYKQVIKYPEINYNKNDYFSVDIDDVNTDLFVGESTVDYESLCTIKKAESWWEEFLTYD